MYETLFFFLIYVNNSYKDPGYIAKGIKRRESNKEKGKSNMERRSNRFRRPNPSSSSSSSSSSREPTTSRSNTFSANPRTSSKSIQTSGDSRSRGKITAHQQKQQDQHINATSDHSAIVGTCSLMCPGLDFLFLLLLFFFLVNRIHIWYV